MTEGFQALTEHEKETLRLLLRGYDIKSIAAGLGLSVHTVNERLRDARRKLGTSSSRQAPRILGDIERGGANFSGDKCYGVGDGTARGANQEHSHRTPGKGHPIAWLGGGMLIIVADHRGRSARFRAPAEGEGYLAGAEDLGRRFTDLVPKPGHGARMAAGAGCAGVGRKLESR